MDQPNIVLITCHDLGDYLGCYGSPVATPNLDGLAEQGVLLERHFSAASICCPSRGSLMTGCYPHTHGLMGLVPRGWEMDVARCPALPTYLVNAGYETHLFGLQHEHWDPQQLGYQSEHPVASNFSEDVTPIFTQWLLEREQHDRPFMANIGLFEPHRIGLASQGYHPSFLGDLPSHFQREVYERASPADVVVPSFMADTPEVRDELADFYGAVTFMDAHVGKILAALDDAGLRDETLVIFVTDHGASFTHSKATLYDGGVKVACMMRWPHALPSGLRIQSLTSHVDMLPTVFNLLALDIPEHVQGRSFAASIRGEPAEERTHVFAEKNYTQYYDPARMVRSETHKYIRKGLRTSIFDFVLTEIELSPASFRTNRAVYDHYSPRRCREELYDLATDPAELNNLAAEPNHASTLAEMRSALGAHLMLTNDPFLDLHNGLLMQPDGYAAVKG